MTMPPMYNFNDLGAQAQNMARNCTSQRTAMIYQYVAVGCMIAMTGLMAAQVLKALGSNDHDRGRGWSR